jgi:membrane-bound lytic murein transglycosylase MltF
MAVGAGPLVLCLAALAAFASDAPAAQTKPAPAPRQLALDAKPWTGDFDAMLQRRMIRVAIPYSRSLYYVDKGRERGLNAELVRDFEQYLNRKYRNKLGKRPLTLYLVPTTRDQLLPNLVSGHADIAVGNLTVTSERRKSVDFAGIHDTMISELIVTGPGAPPLDSLEDLAGRLVHVRESSSYHESLLALDKQLRAAGKRSVEIVLVPEALEDEDLMEMLNAGILKTIVVDDWKAKLWKPVFQRMTIHENVALNEDGHPGWAIRKASPRLAAEVNEFHRIWVTRQNLRAVRLTALAQRVTQVNDPTRAAERRRFDDTIALFRKYGTRYGFDPLMLAAQGYQESGLDQNARSRVGAIGIMQIMPATGASLGVGDIRQVEPNVHAGAKYMDHLMSRYFPDARFSEGNRPLFAFAAYNCGPGNIRKARATAKRRGLDPDKWFNNVEIVVGEQVGLETTTYVRNIYKYYVAYRLLSEAEAAARKARDAVPSNR